VTDLFVTGLGADESSPAEGRGRGITREGSGLAEEVEEEEIPEGEGDELAAADGQGEVPDKRVATVSVSTGCGWPEEGEGLAVGCGGEREDEDGAADDVSEVIDEVIDGMGEAATAEEGAAEDVLEGVAAEDVLEEVAEDVAEGEEEGAREGLEEGLEEEIERCEALKAEMTVQIALAEGGLEETALALANGALHPKREPPHSLP